MAAEVAAEVAGTIVLWMEALAAGAAEAAEAEPQLLACRAVFL